MIVLIRDIRAAKICLSGARDFWVKRGWDWQDFLKNGVDEQILIDTGDAHALRVVQEAHKRAGE